MDDICGWSSMFVVGIFNAIGTVVSTGVGTVGCRLFGVDTEANVVVEWT